MRLLSSIAIIFSLLLGPALADGHGVVNVYSARHYDSDIQLYEKFTANSGIKVNVVSGKSGALEKRIIEEGGGTADLYITVKQPNIVKVLPNVEGPITEAHFVYPASLKNVARITSFRNFLFSKIQEWEF